MNSRISINLLPIEDIALQRTRSRNRLIRLISTAAILAVFFLGSVVLTLRILQSQRIHTVAAQTKVEENKITDLRGKESTLVLLEDRLKLIDKLTANPSKQKVIYDLVVRKIPPSSIVSSVSLDQKGNLSISTTTPNAASLNDLFLVILSNETFQEVANVQVESLSRGQDGAYRASFKLSVK